MSTSIVRKIIQHDKQIRDMNKQLENLEYLNALPTIPTIPTILDAPYMWVQKGIDIDGEAVGDYSGHSVSLSSDGLTVAIGAINNSENGISSGHVRIYKWGGNTGVWVQKGIDLDGETAGDNSGWSVSLSSDGLTVAISSPFSAGSGTGSGHVRIYEWNETTEEWVQKGTDIGGETVGDYSGWSVSLSSDDLIVAIGSAYNDGNGSNSGHVRIYEWGGNTVGWVQKGADIDGETAGDISGRSVSLSSNGLIVAIGARYNDGNGADSGHVRIYEWSGNTGVWVKKGIDIDGETAYDQCGFAVSLSSNGLIVAIGSAYNDGNGSSSGHVRIYEWSETTEEWVQKGIDLNGEAVSDWLGWSVDLSSDGSTVAIGSIHNDGNGISSGHARIYEWSVTTEEWVKKGIDLDGETAGDQFGYSVNLNSDGSTVAIGAPYNDENGADSGHVRVYRFLYI
jgi:hypothetical protein